LRYFMRGFVSFVTQPETTPSAQRYGFVVRSRAQEGFMAATFESASPIPVPRRTARYAVVGAGAIGAYVGASLARGGSDVTLVARGPHLAAMRERGVAVLSERGDFHVRCTATDDASDNGPFDVVIVALKAHQIGPMLPAIRRLCHDRTRIVGMQNGIPWWYFQQHGGPYEGLVLQSVDPGGRIADAFDPANVVGCVIFSSTEIEEPGVIRHVEGTRFALGRPDRGTDPILDEIARDLTAGALKAPIESDLRTQIWVKMVGTAALNPISALTRTTLATMLRDPAIERLVRDVMEECVTIASTLGVTLPVSIDRRIEGARNVGDHKTSMLQDIERGRSPEIDCITGAIVELGSVLGIATPKTAQLHTLTSLLGSTAAAA
jgi:2-dehydropantoate 2-reductase